MIYFIIGASGSGKTACLEPLKHLLSHFIFYDFDDIGVPERADKKWRQEATEQWIKKLTKDSKSKNVCLLGQMVPVEILSSPSISALNLDVIKIILLDCSDEVRIQRLKEYNNDSVNQNTLNWASWLRMHCKDPTWEPHVIKENSSSIMLFSQCEQLINWPSSFQIKRLDTSFLTVHQVAQFLAYTIKTTKRKMRKNNIDITFAEAEISDLDQIIDLLNDDPLGMSREKTATNANDAYHDAFKKIQSDDNAKIIIAYHENNPIAVAQINFIQNLTYQGGVRAQIEGVRVHKDYRSQGVGKKLFKYLISLAQDRSCHLVQLTTDKKRPNAFEFYKKLGFVDSHEGFKLHLY